MSSGQVSNPAALRTRGRKSPGRNSGRRPGSAHGCPTFKICLSGQAGVGKTSIFLRLNNQDPVHKPETGTDFYSYFEAIPTASSEKTVYEFMVNDTAGMETHNSLSLGSYYRNAHCVLLVYDVGDRSSMYYLSDEFTDIQKNDWCPEAKFVVVRNKVDLPTAMQEVKKEEESRFFGGASFGNSIATFVETSAISNHKIEELFKKVVPELLTSSQPVSPKTRLCHNPKSEKISNCCI